jgi:hypothetical protein
MVFASVVPSIRSTELVVVHDMGAWICDREQPLLVQG